MRVLLIKTSSMGDIIHTLPALTDAGRAIPDITFDWMIENSFAEIPKWHPLVSNVIPIALRQWRKNIFSRETFEEFRALRKKIKTTSYDIVLDAQGLIKSAFLSYFAKGKRVGLDWQSARESFASVAYQKKCKVNFYQHAIVRARSLFSQAFNYEMPVTAPDFGLQDHIFFAPSKENYIVFLHGTTWSSKLYPEEYWIKLAHFAKSANLQIKMSGGNDEEIARAMRIANKADNVFVYPKLSIGDMAALLSNAKGAIAVDTGLGHLAAALSVATVSLYGSTNPNFTGALGNKSIHLTADFSCAPCLRRTCNYKSESDIRPACFQLLTPDKVWEKLCSMF